MSIFDIVYTWYFKRKKSIMLDVLLLVVVYIILIGKVNNDV